MRLLLIFALGLVARHGWAAPGEAQRTFEYCLSLAMEEEQAIAGERSVVAGELEAGLERGSWSADDKEAGDALLKKVFDDQAYLWPYGHPAHHAYFRRERFEKYPSTVPSTSRLFAALSRRMEALQLYFQEVHSALCLAALAYADELWLQARHASELAPVVLALTEPKSLAGQWTQAAGLRMQSKQVLPQGAPVRIMSAPFLQQHEAAELIDYWSIVASPDPLVLPDPAADPAGYTRFHALWLELQRRGHLFARRPAIRRGVAESEEQFRRAAGVALAEVKAAILRGAPLAELRAAVVRLRKFSDQVDLRPSLHPGRQPPPGFPDSLARQQPLFPRPGDMRGGATQLDYRGLISDLSSRPLYDPLLADAVLEECHRYYTWTGLLEAEERRQSVAVAQRQETLRKALLGVRGPEIDRMRAHLPAEPPEPVGATAVDAEQEQPRPAVTTSGDPVAALLASLEAVAAWDSSHQTEQQPKARPPFAFSSQRAAAVKPQPNHPQIGPLIALWRAVQRRENVVKAERDPGTAQAWMALALLPEGATLLELRDRTAWAALGRPEHDAGSDLATELMTQFEAALARSAWDAAERLLTLDRACAVFTSPTGAACGQTLQRMRSAAEFASKGPVEQARETYRAVILEDATPNSGVLAARALKALPAAAKPATRRPRF